MHKTTVMTVRDPKLVQVHMARLSTNIAKSGVYRLDTEPSTQATKATDIVLVSDKFQSQEDFLSNLIQDLLALQE